MTSGEKGKGRLAAAGGERDAERYGRARAPRPYAASVELAGQHRRSGIIPATRPAVRVRIIRRILSRRSDSKDAPYRCAVRLVKPLDAMPDAVSVRAWPRLAFATVGVGETV